MISPQESSLIEPRLERLGGMSSLVEYPGIHIVEVSANPQPI
jgi:hypothetical protein